MAKPAQGTGKAQGTEGKGSGENGVEGAFATLFGLIGGGTDVQTAMNVATGKGQGAGEGVSFAALAAGMAAKDATANGDATVVGLDGKPFTGGTDEGETLPGMVLPGALEGDAAATTIKLTNQLHGQKAAKLKAEQDVAQVEDGKSGKTAKSGEESTATLAKSDEATAKDEKVAIKADVKTDQTGEAASAVVLLASVLQQDVGVVKTAVAPTEIKSAGKDGAIAKAGDAASDTAAQALVQQAQADGSNGQGDASAQDQGARTGHGIGLGKSGVGEGEAKLAASPFQEIVDALPPGIQAQLSGTPATLALDAPAATVQATSHADALNDQVIDMGVSGQWIDRMAREIASLADGTGHSRFQLSPPNLGRIQVDLWQGDGATNLRMVTETDEAARRLREGQGALEANARVASLSLGSVTVEKASAPFEAKDQNQNQQNPRQQADLGGQQQQQTGQQAGGDASFSRGSLNRGGIGAVMGGGDQQAEPASVVPATGTDGRRVRFA
jgi:flagellar hook-length control protein FliK